MELALAVGGLVALSSVFVGWVAWSDDPAARRRANAARRRPARPLGVAGPPMTPGLIRQTPLA
ncbi:MAG TPA: hypothetical protein VFI69_08170 [Candidatus Limnocylindrales bacterium]|jgi:hypothetical protein|nr:hypothetical protein [Candidatus Limnocylindrales bacterium]